MQFSNRPSSCFHGNENCFWEIFLPGAEFYIGHWFLPANEDILLSFCCHCFYESALFLFSSSAPQSAFTVFLFAFDLLKFDYDVSRYECLKCILLGIHRTLISLVKFLTIFLPQMTHSPYPLLCPFHLGLYLHMIHVTFDFSLTLALFLCSVWVVPSWLTFLFWCLLLSTFAGILIFVTIFFFFFSIREA